MTDRQPSVWYPASWPLLTRLGAALAAVGVLLIGCVAVSAVMLMEAREDQDLVDQDYYAALQASQAYFLGLVDSETAVRGFALSGQESMLEPSISVRPPAEHPLSPQIIAMLPDKLVPLEEMQQVELAATAWYREWAEPTIARVRAKDKPTAAEVSSGRQLFDRFRSAYDIYYADVLQGRTEALNNLSLMTSLLFAGVITSALLATIGGGLLWYLMRRWVSVPINRLAAEARVVSNGDLDHELTAEGPVEFIQLGEDVEAMRLRLVAQIAEVEAAGVEVAQARAALEEQTLELQRSNRELEQFAYVASHDLQEPLRKVASFCQMLQRRYSGQLDERADQYIHFAVDGAKRMQQLINDLLEFSRVGRLITPRTDVDLMDCLRNGLFNLETARGESEAEVTWDELPHVLGEAPLLTQLLQNLIGNAIKFRSAEPPRVHLGVVRKGDTWEFWCSDNGIGIEPEYVERVFLIFQRLHAKEAYGGTGIGLAMCKKIVEHHGGRIWVDHPVEGSVASGATVRFTLPVVSSSAAVESAHLSDVSS